ncbi:uncharacterized protein RJT21DRAFT_132005 [Scheffersomyces amazonensis]|uniref:uncharacterized protein n=1 Tax=Scheffersomyces amazonensis TaxID=1078765 RepID=UPI00315D46D9
MTKVTPVSALQVMDATIQCIPELQFMSPANIKHLYYNLIKSNPYVIQMTIFFTSLKSTIYQQLPDYPSINQVLQYSWITSHFMTIIGTFLFCLNITGDSLLWYWISLFGSVLTYSLVTYHHCLINLSSSDSGGPNNEITLVKIINSENTPLLGMTLLALFTPTNSFKLLPSTIYSLLNLINYVLIELHPTSKLSSLTVPLFGFLEEKLLLLAVNIELGNLFVYGIQSILSRYAYSSILYFMLICLKIQNSYYCCEAIKQWYSVITFFTGSTLLKDEDDKEDDDEEEEKRTIVAKDEAYEDPIVHDKEEEAYKKSVPVINTSYFDHFSLSSPKQPTRITSLMFDTLSVINDVNFG